MARMFSVTLWCVLVALEQRAWAWVRPLLSCHVQRHTLAL